MGESSPVVAVGDNNLRLWGLTPRMRLERIAARSGCVLLHEPLADGATILVNLDYVFDPAWLLSIKASPRTVLTLDDKPVIANCPDAANCASVRQAMLDDAPMTSAELALVPFESATAKTNDELRKRERPFAGRLTSRSTPDLERASYYSAYKGVTDLLTKYLWPEWALTLTRIAARIGLSPNAVTAIGAVFCLAATWFFFTGAYWVGLAAGLVFMVLDTVDGKLARCTLTSSKLGEVFDHGIDLIHPPFWYWAWGAGLINYGLPLGAKTFTLVLSAIIVGYIVQRLVEGAFIAAFSMHIHVWRKFDSAFRLVTARRNPNMVILFVALALQRPDIGLIAVAVWTWLSLAVHLVQLVQAFVHKAGGRAVVSWLT